LTIDTFPTFDNSRSGAGRIRLLILGPVICVIALACFGCYSGQQPMTATASVILSGDQSGGQQPMTATASVILGGDRRHSDPFRLRSAAVNDDVLAVEVSYSGGCRNHELVLLAPRSFQTMSNSVQLEITLIHDANDDTCEAFLTDLLRFDLLPIKRLYQLTYSRDTGTVFLRLDGHSGPLVYRF
jgi:hypothetical protein